MQGKPILRGVAFTRTPNHRDTPKLTLSSNPINPLTPIKPNLDTNLDTFFILKSAFVSLSRSLCPIQPPRLLLCAPDVDALEH